MVRHAGTVSLGLGEGKFGCLESFEELALPVKVFALGWVGNVTMI